jgi:DNA invertase Pin-like site-specific DNA recombinase
MSTASYIRVSRDTQDVERQRVSIAAWAQRAGDEITLAFEDSEGRNPRDQAHKRPAFQRMLAAVQAGLVSRIVVDSQDRFGTRDAYQWGRFIDLLREHGCELIDASGKILSADDDAAVLTGTIGALTSTREQKEKARRSIAGKIVKAQRGEYQGGYAPFGCDVICFNADGKEKWRTVYIGHYDRWKVWPNGERERFKGKDNSPQKDVSDFFALRPSIEKDRIKIVRQIFDWYLTEAISPGRIAERLNAAKVDCIFGEAWNKVKIAALLSNPVYVGKPAWNKRGSSRFVEFTGGELHDVSRQAKSGRKRTHSDIIAIEQFKPMIAPATWQAVQDKIEASKQGKRRPSNTEAMYLKPFLFCGRCGKPMRATVGQARLMPSYFCGTYGTYGKANPTGCKVHRVRHDDLERIVDDYLKQTAPRVTQLIHAADTGDLDAAKPLLQAFVDTAVFYGEVEAEMMTFIERHSTKLEERGYRSDGTTFEDMYGLIYERIRPKAELEITRQEQQLDRMLDQYADLTGELRERMRGKMEALQTEITRRKVQLIDWRMPWANLREDLTARKAALAQAQKMLKGSDARRKGEALRHVIDRIDCHFSPETGSLDRLEIVSVSGETVSRFTDGNWSGRD